MGEPEDHHRREQREGDRLGGDVLGPQGLDQSRGQDRAVDRRRVARGGFGVALGLLRLSRRHPHAPTSITYCVARKLRGRGGGAGSCAPRRFVRCPPRMPEAPFVHLHVHSRVLDPRRRLPDPGPRQAGRRARDAGRLAHRPRLDGGRGPALQGGEGHGREADHRLRGLRRRRPPRPEEGLRAPDAARRRQRRLLEPDQALEPRLPRGLLLQAARRLGAARAALGRA